MEVNDFDEKLRGKQILILESKFDDLLSSIQINHAKYFENRPSRIAGEKHDNIKNHFIYTHFGGKSTVVFLDNSTLDNDIKSEITNAFHDVFGKPE